MKKLYRLAAFPKTKDGGNKAGVYLYADDLSDSEMQNIAKDLGYSETAFVSQSQIADFKVRFFTPSSEVNLCGHATIATFNLLRDLNIITNKNYTQETKVGILKLQILDNIVFMEQNKPFFGDFIPKEELMSCFNYLEFDDVLKPQIISTGLKEIFLPVKNKSVLDNLSPDFDKIVELSKKHNVIGIHAFSLDDTVDAYGRNFAPIVGINEESATGTSNGALACYLYKHHIKKSKYILRQGYSMNQPSELVAKIEASNHQIYSIWVGGSAHIIK